MGRSHSLSLHFILNQSLSWGPRPARGPKQLLGLPALSRRAWLCRTLDRTSVSHAGLQAEAVVRGKLLGKLLNSILSQSGNDEYARTLLDCILHDSAGKLESLYDIIAAAFHSNFVPQHFILDWLQNHDGCFTKLCRSLSPGVCTVLCRQSSEFKQEYMGVLKHWASCLEYEVLESQWVPADGQVSFNMLSDRFKDLLNSGPPLKEETETELKTLKSEAGDFNVKGINIWTDLIIQLKMGII